jgi:hypothetical protein
MNSEILTLWSSQPGLSLLVWLLILIVVMYCGRKPAHLVLRTAGRSIYQSLRLLSKAINKVEIQLADRNRDVLLAAGAENLERNIEREFVRVNAVVSRDLANYPALHRQISDTIDNIEKDFKEATDSPPLPPAWLDAVESIAAIPRNGDPAVTKILKNIHKTVESAYTETQKAFQKNTLERHRLLGGMQPMWRTLIESLNKVKGKIDGLDERSSHIDKHMENYEKMRSGDDDIMRVLASSSLTQFFISSLVLVVAIMGGLINFQLIALPMSEMVGGTSYIGSFKTSDIAALVIILIEIAMGLFLMESLRITRLFPVIGSMDDKMRKRMLIITFSILFVLASIEASLAYMRDLLALDREALTQSLTGAGVTETQFRWIPSIGQMVMGFILPFALAFVAIPLESFIHSLRTVLGMVLIAILKLISILVRVIASFCNQLSKVLIHLYDFVIMVPLSVEKMIKASSGLRNRGKDETKSFNQQEPRLSQIPQELIEEK